MWDTFTINPIILWDITVWLHIQYYHNLFPQDHCKKFWLFLYFNPEYISWRDHTDCWVIFTNQGFCTRYTSKVVNKDTCIDYSHILSMAPSRVICEYSSISSNVGLSLRIPNSDSIFLRFSWKFLFISRRSIDSHKEIGIITAVLFPDSSKIYWISDFVSLHNYLRLS